ncbi:hypothetical protein [Streptomyces sp. NPDC048481]
MRTSALRVWVTAGLVVPPRERGTRYRLHGPSRRAEGAGGR